ncbi:MAG: ribose 5-phosphate isomerase B [Bacteroidetes bacterium]|nr:ribose 5-phosphate isomerase B [Bacteroidota bacterium]
MVDSKHKIAIASDHAGYCLKESVKKALSADGYSFQDFGTYSEESVDYPDFVHPLAKAIENKSFEKGIIICGSGNGVAMVANKYPDIRAAVCWNEEIAKLARMHNDSNVISLPARFITEENAVHFVKIFLTTEFEGGKHDRRVKKIAAKI